ncbi:pro-corazonin-like [Homalodisca vitripennis]|uniref:pro-corazonin-like n=1 Tax=Homalodisca vitripennis TaxID=197043 RepID=UPI001EEAA310|nr:pro-corazonin-like [Homalodisca vitripennis]KAG8269255.1 hypothetical protein J6590_004551 [Homalodisca vitripennis]
MVNRNLAWTLLLLCCLAGSLLAQTFQYSRGWTNGKKRSGQPSPHEAACQLQKLRIILEGKNTAQLYWPCDWQQPPLDYEPHHIPQPPPLMDIDNN